MKKLLVIGWMMGLFLIAFGCSSFTTEKKEVKVNKGSFLIEKDEAKELDVQLKMGVGGLTVSKGTKNWVEGRFNTNYKGLEPIVTYAHKNQKGTVVIEQQNDRDIRIGNIKNEWDVELSEDIPLDLSVMTGAASAKLDLRELQLNRLDIETGVGECILDLSGDWQKGFETTIETGVGATTIVLPSDVGVRIKVEKGIGMIQASDLISKEAGVYINEAYEKADVILEISVEMGVGEVTFELDK